MLFVIVESLWSVVHLEFDVELIKGTALPLLVNLTSVRLLWTFLWGNLKRVRRERGHVITRPRLQTLKVTANIPSSF